MSCESCKHGHSPMVGTPCEKCADEENPNWRDQLLADKIKRRDNRALLKRKFLKGGLK